MSVSFLASSHRFLTVTGVTDVATLITSLRSELVTNGNPAWTEPATAKFKSPVDAAGRWFSAEFIKTNATTLRMIVRPKNDATLWDTSFYIDSGGTDVHIATGERHIQLTSMRATPEDLNCGMLDLYPDADDTCEYYVYAKGYRRTADLADLGYINFDIWGLNDGSMWLNCMARRLLMLKNVGGDGYGWVYTLQSPSGTRIIMPVFIMGYVSGVFRLVGQLFQHYVVYDESTPVGSTVTLPIDDQGTTALFRVTGVQAASAAGTGYTRGRLLVRSD